MSTAISLLLYGAAVCLLAPRLLPRLIGTRVSPRWGVALWLVMAGGVLAAWLSSALALGVWLVSTSGRPTRWVWEECWALLRSFTAGEDGLDPRLVLVLFAASTALAATVFLVRVARGGLRSRRRTRHHAQSARIVGRRVERLNAWVIAAPENLVYCLPGRPETIVMTSAAVDTLGQGQHLDAVLSHERAHLRGRHHLLLAATRVVANAAPRLTMFTVAANEVARLLELCADDAAVRVHGRTAVLGALMALSSAAQVPSGALGATSGGLGARVSRLIASKSENARTGRAIQPATVAAIVLAVPLLVGWSVVDVLIVCGPLTA